MSSQQGITVHATDKTGLTLAELYQFVQDAERAGIDPRSPLHVRAGFRGQPLRITAGARS